MAVNIPGTVRYNLLEDFFTDAVKLKLEVQDWNTSSNVGTTRYYGDILDFEMSVNSQDAVNPQAVLQDIGDAFRDYFEIEVNTGGGFDEIRVRKIIMINSANTKSYLEHSFIDVENPSGIVFDEDGELHIDQFDIYFYEGE